MTKRSGLSWWPVYTAGLLMMGPLFYLGLTLVLALFALNFYLAIREEKRR